MFLAVERVLVGLHPGKQFTFYIYIFIVCAPSKLEIVGVFPAV